MKKRFQYWGLEDGKPKILWSDFYEWNTDYQPKWQLKNKLKNEYKDE